jgi:hypothetical protein
VRNALHRSGAQIIAKVRLGSRAAVSASADCDRMRTSISSCGRGKRKRRARRSPQETPSARSSTLCIRRFTVSTWPTGMVCTNAVRSSRARASTFACSPGGPPGATYIHSLKHCIAQPHRAVRNSGQHRARGQNFDWARCFGTRRPQSQWIGCALAVARELLECDIPLEAVKRIGPIPSRLILTVLDAWLTRATLGLDPRSASCSISRPMRRPSWPAAGRTQSTWRCGAARRSRIFHAGSGGCLA